MKRFLITLAAATSIISTSSFALSDRPYCDLNDPGFCGCYINNFHQNCASHLPATCRRYGAGKIKFLVGTYGVRKSCSPSQQTTVSPEECEKATNKFLSQC